MSPSSSTIAFQCPHCGHRTEVKVEFGGQSGPCVSCSQTITVPTRESLQVSASSAQKRSPGRSLPLPMKIGIAAGGVAAVCLVGFLLYSFITPIVNAARAAALTTQCEENLLAIGTAIEAYYQENGHYPPAVVRDETGKAMHSWRVLILPYLGTEAQKIYELYNMEEPWDGPTNGLLTEIPPEYTCPCDPKLLAEETSYLAVVGQNAVINDSSPTKKRNAEGQNVLIDRPSETIVVVEAVNCGVKWYEPRDISVSALRAGINSNNPIGANTIHPHGLNTLMADGTVLRLPAYTSPEDLRGMATINGNEYVEVMDELLYSK